MYVLLGIGVLYFILLMCLWKNIYVSVIILKTASVILIQNTRIYLLPFMCAFFLLLWMVTWLFNAAQLISTGNITQPTAGSQMKVVELTDEQKYMLFGQVFMFFWVYEII